MSAPANIPKRLVYGELAHLADNDPIDAGQLIFVFHRFNLGGPLGFLHAAGQLVRRLFPPPRWLRRGKSRWRVTAEGFCIFPPSAERPKIARLRNRGPRIQWLQR